MNRTILVVDADPIQRKVVQQELGDAGFEVLLASSGEEGLTLFAEHAPLLSIVEINLPDEPGTQICRTMKTDPELPGGLVVLVSAGVKEVNSVADAALQFHADFYMTKPYQVERLIWKTAELIRGRHVGLAPGHEWPIGLELPTMSLGGGTGVSTGDLRDVDPATLLFSFTVHRRSGSVVFTDGSNVRQVVFRAGLPIAADSNARGEEFGSFAVDLGTCDAAQMARARDAWETIDRHLGVVAVAEGSMGARDLFRTMRQHLEHVLMASMAMRHGEYYLEFGGVPANFDPVGLPWLPAEYAMRGIAQGYDDETCYRRLGEGWLRSSRHAGFVVRELADPAIHQPLLDRLERPARAIDLVEEGRVAPGDGSLQRLLGLRTIGALWVVDPARVYEVRGARLGSTAEMDPIGLAEGDPPSLSIDVDDPSLDTERDLPAVPPPVAEVTAEQHYERGIAEFGAARFQAARDSFERAIALEPARARYHQGLAQTILLDEGAHEHLRERALDHLRRAIQLDPRRADAYHFLGVALMEDGRRDEAEFALRKALKLRTRHAKDTQRLLDELARS